MGSRSRMLLVSVLLVGIASQSLARSLEGNDHLSEQKCMYLF
jgi:hypothetical protein